jgi:cob(I)alamin adenosyltransferase
MGSMKNKILKLIQEEIRFIQSELNAEEHWQTSNESIDELKKKLEFWNKALEMVRQSLPEM